MISFRRIFLLDWLSYFYLRGKERQPVADLSVRGRGVDMPEKNAKKENPVLDQICSPDAEVRHAAAQQLPKSADPLAPDALVRLLEDEDLSVRWTAMQNLVSSGRKAIEPLLVALTHDFESSNLRQGARHIFQTLNEFGMLNRAEVTLLHTLEKSDHAVEVAEAANKALLANMQVNQEYALKKYNDLDCK